VKAGSGAGLSLALGLGTSRLLGEDTPGEAANARRLPNFIVILCDDLHYSDVGCFGSTEIPTPQIDRLSAPRRNLGRGPNPS
jgi:hypothetical protein